MADNDQAYEFVDVWQNNTRPGKRECTSRICEQNHNHPCSEVGYPPAHTHCICYVVEIIQPKPDGKP